MSTSQGIPRTAGSPQKPREKHGMDSPLKAPEEDNQPTSSPSGPSDWEGIFVCCFKSHRLQNCVKAGPRD